MEHHTTTSRAEAERLLGIAEKLLGTKDFNGSRDFAILAQETEPLLEGSDQILAVAEVHNAADQNRLSNNQPDWYSILQVPQRSNDADLIKKQYRRLALLLHPDKNKFPYSDDAFRLVANAWAVLCDPSKKSLYDTEFAARFTKVDLVAMKKQQQHNFQQQRKGREAKSGNKLPVRRSARGGARDGDDEIRSDNQNTGGASTYSDLPEANIWTACPYCYNLYEYPRKYEGCCLRCDNEKCKRAFTATEILSMPPTVPGKEAYYCCWGFFPMGFASGGDTTSFPKWMPPIFGGGAAEPPPPPPAAPAPTPPPLTTPPPTENTTPVNATPTPAAATSNSTTRKRGRPRKNL